MRTAASGFFAQQAVSMVSKQAFDESGNLTPSAESWLTRAVTVQRPLVLANLRRCARSIPRSATASWPANWTRSSCGS